jgi:hypothetical protein
MERGSISRNEVEGKEKYHVEVSNRFARFVRFGCRGGN